METDVFAWKSGVGPQTLPDSEVHLWRISLSQGTRRIQELAALLSVEERRDTDGIHFEKDKTSFLLCRGFLRLLLGRYTGIAPGEIRFRAGSRGKLSLDGSSSASGVEFNLSHSGGVALFALATGRRLGVDVEKIRPSARIDDMARSFFSPREARSILALSGPAKVAAFYACWTRKEAVIKALGGSIMELSAEVVVSAAAGEPARLLRLPRGHGGLRAWRLHDLPISEGYTAALCHEAPTATICLWESPEWPAAGK